MAEENEKADVMNFALTSEQEAILAMTRGFASDRIAPHTVKWDADKHFPVDVLAEAGALGLGGIYTRDDVGGTGLGRLDAVLIFEALAGAVARSLLEAKCPRPS